MKAKEEAMSRKDIMDRINKWLAACDEETWLDEYNKVNNFCFFWSPKKGKWICVEHDNLYIWIGAGHLFNG